jgi:hypothetical protein
MMQRRTKSILPTTEKLLQPKLNKQVNQQQEKKQKKQAMYYNQNAKDLPKVKSGDVVRVQPDKYKKEWKKAKVMKEVELRSYEVITESGVKLRRNRKFLRKTQEQYARKIPEQQNYTEEQADLRADKKTAAATRQAEKTSKQTTRQQPASTQSSSNQSASVQPPSNQGARKQPRSKQPSRTTAENQQVSTRAGRKVKKPKYLQEFVTT